MLDLASLLFGMFLGIFIFATTKAVQQTQTIWKHTHSLNNTYLFLVWGEIVANFVFCLTTFLFICKVIPGS